MIGERLKYIREYFDYKQIDIASVLNVKQPTYWLWENDVKIIPLKHLNTLSNFYNISIDYLLGLSDENVKYSKLDILDKKIIGNNLLEFRKDNNITQVKLAEMLHTTHSTISAYEAGKTLILTAFLYQICKTYNISMDELCGKVKV